MVYKGVDQNIRIYIIILFNFIMISKNINAICYGIIHNDYELTKKSPPASLGHSSS